MGLLRAFGSFFSKLFRMRSSLSAFILLYLLTCVLLSSLFLDFAIQIDSYLTASVMEVWRIRHLFSLVADCI
jgi:hypothetical protein